MLPPLSLYVHVPWCEKKCPYCDFNSHSIPGAHRFLSKDLEESYFSALIRDMKKSLLHVDNRELESIFFGGGTPSLLSSDIFSKLIRELRNMVSFKFDIEITLEVNPSSAEARKFEGFRDAGVNRLSIGVQSFNSRHLKRIGRVHSQNDAWLALNLAAKYFDNFNVDLMYGLPNQTLEETDQDIRNVIGVQPTHISFYNLTLEPNTFFAKFPPNLPPHDLVADMQDLVEGSLKRRGFLHYETAAFSRPQRECRHNLNYWNFGDYLGIGPGAHSKLTSERGILRMLKLKSPEKYLKTGQEESYIQDSHQIQSSELFVEFMINSTRLNFGFDLRKFTERTGLPIRQDILMALGIAEAEGYIKWNGSYVLPTRKGQKFSNDLIRIFM